MPPKSNILKNAEKENVDKAKTAPRKTRLAKNRLEMTSLAARQAMQSKLLAANFGNIVSLLMQSPIHKDLSLEELSTVMVPAMLSNQFAIAEVRGKTNGYTKPTGLAFWAKVSEDVDRRLIKNPEKQIRLAANEWQSGEIFWLIELFGEKTFVSSLQRNLKEKVFRDHPVKFRTLDGSGKIIIRTLEDTVEQNDDVLVVSAFKGQE